LLLNEVRMLWGTYEVRMLWGTYEVRMLWGTYEVRMLWGTYEWVCDIPKKSTLSILFGNTIVNSSHH